MTQKMIDELIEEISSSWRFPKEKPVTPILLIMAGYQGSGKTTTLKKLQGELGLIIVSPDEIRHKLFARKIPFSNEFVELVDGIRVNLIRRALKLGCSFAIDTNVTPKRMEVLEKFLSEEDETEYKVVKVLLEAPQEVLAERVGRRPTIEGLYKGTVDELHASMKEHGTLDPAAYDLAIDTSKSSPEDTFEAIKKAIT